jgi:serine protein kinase
MADSKNDLEDFLEMISSHLEDSKEEMWEGTLSDYIKMVIKNPEIHMNAHQRVLKAIETAGIERDEDGDIVKYKFFENDLFGVDEPIEELMSYLRAAAAGSEVGRRILLLYGPTSSGKSQLAILLKRGLEKFSKTDAGAIYCLSDSPMHEDPLTAVPLSLRPKFLEEYGIKIDGEISPLMEMILNEEYDGNFMNLKVKRYYISERGRKSIGTFVPSDKKSQDISELIGSLDLSTIGKFGSESDPRAYRFDGELNVANRGLMEFVEMLKVDQKFLYVLLTLAQEKNIKTGRFPLIWADEFVLAHTNETEYRRFLAQDEMEALHDRTIVARFPYNLQLEEEIKIYEKLIKQATFDSVHIAPHTLRCAAIFAILSRLKESNDQGLSLLNKMRLYNGEDVDGYSSGDISKFKKEFENEGMSGLSPRYVINRISSSLAEDNIDTITPIDIIRSLRDGLSTNPKIDKKATEALEGLILNQKLEIFLRIISTMLKHS